MGKTFKVRNPGKPKKKKRLGGIESDIIFGRVQLGGAGKHADKRKREKYKKDWYQYE